jgi:hypothetical protein
MLNGTWLPDSAPWRFRAAFNSPPKFDCQVAYCMAFEHGENVAQQHDVDAYATRLRVDPRQYFAQADHGRQCIPRPFLGRCRLVLFCGRLVQARGLQRLVFKIPKLCDIGPAPVIGLSRGALQRGRTERKFFNDFSRACAQARPRRGIRGGATTMKSPSRRDV